VSSLNQEALEHLVRHAMAAGVAAWADRLRDGLIDMGAPLVDCFGDAPADFLRIRPGLLEGLIEP
jgi:hypothetical protein